LIVLAALLAFTPVPQAEEDLFEPVVRINGTPVAKGEFLILLSQQRAAVFNYFRDKYGTQDHPTFWTTSYGGEIPAEKAKELALKEIVRIKTQQQLAQQHGILVDTSYAAFSSKLQQENQRRKQMVDQGQVIYGPIQYDEAGYYDYLISNMIIDLKEQLVNNNVIIFTDTSLQSFYELNKERYRKIPTLRAQVIAIQYTDDTDKLAAKTKIDQVRKILSDGDSMAKLGQSYRENPSSNIVYQEELFDESTSRHDDLDQFRLAVKTVAETLEVNQVSDVFEIDKHFYIISVIEKNTAYKSFDEVRDHVRSDYIDKQYDALVEQLIREAEAEVQPAYSKLKLS